MDEVKEKLFCVGRDYFSGIGLLVNHAGVKMFDTLLIIDEFQFVYLLSKRCIEGALASKSHNIALIHLN